MPQIARIDVGDSQFHDRLWKLLTDTGIEPEEFEDLEYFSLIPFFVIAGASVETQVEAHGDHFHFRGVTLHVPEELEEMFFAVLPQMLGQVDGDEPIE
ncbi:MAG: hypothetical protein JHC95_14730 [Solirubrobacteraceae bacterium]|nr:hypothetical protein [Solirubrobacteraceae bacterium]